MTALLSRVEQVMGWDDRVKYSTELNTLEYPGTKNDYWLSHLLVEKMVGDGWHVHIYFVKGQPVQAEAFRANPRGKELSQDCQDEPAAILALFVKVYGLEG